MWKTGDKKTVSTGACNGSTAHGLDFDHLQQQLLELSDQDNGVMAMIDLIN